MTDILNYSRSISPFTPSLIYYFSQSVCLFYLPTPSPPFSTPSITFFPRSLCSLPHSPNLPPSLSASLPPSHLSLSLSKGNIIENLAGTPKIESGQRERERESIRAKKRGKERRRARTKTLSHLIFRWRFLFAVNNLSLPLSSACSASDRHIYLMQMSIKYVEKKEKEQWLFKNDTYKLSLLRIRKLSQLFASQKNKQRKKHYISAALHW